jgi:hypothetical protein
MIDRYTLPEMAAEWSHNGLMFLGLENDMQAH